jgi:peptidoglycan hydrolase-like protein with peptidoglycan-binding domain
MKGVMTLLALLALGVCGYVWVYKPWRNLHAPANFPLAAGSAGREVAELQRVLNKAYFTNPDSVHYSAVSGIAPLVITGVFDAATAAAVKLVLYAEELPEVQYKLFIAQMS